MEPAAMETRKRIYEFIVSYLTQHGYPPVMREIAEGVELKSASTVHGHLQEMFADGTLETDPGTDRSRAIRVPGYQFVRMGSRSGNLAGREQEVNEGGRTGTGDQSPENE